MRGRSFLRNAPAAVQSIARSTRRTRPTRSSLRANRNSDRQANADGTERVSLVESNIDDLSDFSPSSSKSPQSGEPTTSFFTNVIGAILSRRFGLIALITLFVVALICTLFSYRFSFYAAYLRMSSVPPGLYSRDGKLYVGRDTLFHIKGFSWFGMEEEHHILGGLTKTTVEDVLVFAKKNQFNVIRIPLSVPNVLANPITERGFGTFHNGEFARLPYLHLISSIAQKAAKEHVLILLDMHRLKNEDVKSRGIWYTDDVPEDKLAAAWQILCKHLKNEWNIIGADLVNEPWNATWSTSETDKRNWKRAAESLGNAIHDICPSWVIFIEGVGNRAGKVSDNVFWSENLHVMESNPPSLKLKHKVVLSPHVYGPSVFMQEYFKPNNFIKDMPKKWQAHFGSASNVTGLATVVGEWGGTLQGKDEVWQKRFMEYLVDNGIGFFYWCLNPESSDTGGLLHDDWIRPVTAKLNILKRAPSTSVEDNIIHFQYGQTWRT